MAGGCGNLSLGKYFPKHFFLIGCMHVGFYVAKGFMWAVISGKYLYYSYSNLSIDA